jgi:hypothetical protein
MSPLIFLIAVKKAMRERQEASDRAVIAQTVAAVMAWHARGFLYSDLIDRDPHGIRARIVASGWLTQRSADELCLALDMMRSIMTGLAHDIDRVDSLSAIGEADSVDLARSVCRAYEDLGACLRTQAWGKNQLAEPSVRCAYEQAAQAYEALGAKLWASCDQWIQMAFLGRERLAMMNDEIRAGDEPCVAHWVRIVESWEESVRDRLGDLDGGIF